MVKLALTKVYRRCYSLKVLDDVAYQGFVFHCHWLVDTSSHLFKCDGELFGLYLINLMGILQHFKNLQTNFFS